MKQDVFLRPKTRRQRVNDPEVSGAATFSFILSFDETIRTALPTSGSGYRRRFMR
jgi:hypothetical protein